MLQYITLGITLVTLCISLYTLSIVVRNKK